MINICVFGLGYVGLPLALSFSKKYNTVGFDVDTKKIVRLQKNIDSNKEFSPKDFKNKKILFSSEINHIKKCNYYIICVPTPINKKKEPDLSALKKSFFVLKNLIKKNDTIIVESTVYPGVTNMFGDYIEKNSKLKKNKDFYLCYSPERINPGDNTKKLKKIDKIFSTESNNNKKINEIKKIYKLVSKKLIFSKSIAESETAKVIENIQRDLNIALFNEILIICDRLNINFNEVIRLASTKWNFIKFKPGLVGGHCLPVDPYYLSHVSKLNKFKLITTLAGRKTNSYMKYYVLNKFKSYVKKKNISKNYKILVIGLTYKYGVPDMRNSINYQIFNIIKNEYKNTKGYDPFVKFNNNIVKIKDISKFDLFVFLSDGEKFRNIFHKAKKLKKKIINPFKYFD